MKLTKEGSTDIESQHKLSVSQQPTLHPSSLKPNPPPSPGLRSNWKRTRTDQKLRRQMEKRRNAMQFRQALLNSSSVVVDLIDTSDEFKKRRSDSALTESFFNQASFHGTVLKNTSGKERVFWMIILVLATGGLLFEVTKVTVHYIQAPTATEVHVDSLHQIDFPAIVLCNLNPLNRTWLEEQGISLRLALYAQHVYITTKNDVQPSMNVSAEYGLKRELDAYLGRFPNRDLRHFFDRAGYACSEFLQSCAFQWKSLNCCQFAQPVFDIHFGKCFLLDGHFKQLYPAAGLQLKIKVHRDLYVPRFASPSVGVALRILKVYDPSATEYSYVSPGKHIAVQLDETSQTYMNTLTKKICRDNKTISSNITTAPYTQNQCIALCFNTAAIQECNCTYPQDKRLFGVNRNVPPVCTPWESVKCLMPKVENNRNVHSCATGCLPGCTQTQFRMSLSMADLPETTYYGSTSAGLENASPRRAMVNTLSQASTSKSFPQTTSTQMGDHLILDIFFSKIQRTNVEEVFIVTPDNLISQIGGLMGIFLGASLITIIQICSYCCRYVYGKFDVSGTKEGDANNNTTNSSNSNSAEVTETTFASPSISRDCPSYEIAIERNGTAPIAHKTPPLASNGT